MRRLAIALVLALVAARPVQPAPARTSSCALVTSGSSDSVGASGSPHAITITTTGANLLILAISWDNSRGTASPSDTLSNTWTAVEATGIEGNMAHRMWYAENATVGVNQQFLPNGGNAYQSQTLLAVSGAVTSSVLTDHAAAHAPATTTIAPGSITPSLGDEFIATSYGYAATGSSSVNGGFTKQEEQSNMTLTTGNAIAYLIQGAATTANPTWTHGSSDGLAAQIGAFRCTSSVAQSAGVPFIIGGRLRSR